MNFFLPFNLLKVNDFENHEISSKIGVYDTYRNS